MRKEYWWLFLIVIIAAYLRVANLASIPPGLYPDEAINGNNALEALETHEFKVFYPENNGREGLFINIQALSLYFLGNEPLALRLPSAIFGILTVLGMYFLTKELFNRSDLFEKNVSEGERDCSSSKIKPSAIALLSSFLLSVSFWHINFSRIGFRAIMAPFFLVWGIYFLLKAIRLAKEKISLKYCVLNSIFSGIFYGLGFYSYISYRATPLIILCVMVIFLIKAKKENWLKHFRIAAFTFIAFTVLVTMPLNIHFLNNPQDFLGRTNQISIFSSETPVKDLSINIIKTAGMFNISGDLNWRHNISGNPLLFWPIGIIFLIGLILSLRSLATKSDNPASLPSSLLDKRGELKTATIILLTWLGAAAAPVVISNEGLPHALRAILMAPPIIIISGLGGMWLFRQFEGKIQVSKLKTTALMILALIAVEAYASYFIIWGKNPNTADAFSENYVKIARELNALPKETPKFVVVNASGVDVRGIPMPAQTIMFITDTFRNEEKIDKNIRYITPAQIPETVFPANAFIRYLN